MLLSSSYLAFHALSDLVFQRAVMCCSLPALSLSLSPRLTLPVRDLPPGEASVRKGVTCNPGNASSGTADTHARVKPLGIAARLQQTDACREFLLRFGDADSQPAVLTNQ